ncbi:thiolase [Baekduia soli]|uniref:Thiolase n=1 Tax=Baekduia soli TaxID=496014 RepID=A0A5B8U241_9ACTN|nr:acetyl-CoA acetyltransferase [Baekduia soli]QEC47124.1 thiolase [Baekduia soli]
MIAIAGAAEVQLGKALPGLSASDVMADAALAALDDAGLTTQDVDGLFASSTQMPWATVNLGEDLRIQPRYSDSTMLGGSSPMAHLEHARAAIAAGLCEVALIAYGSTQRSVGRSKASVQEIDPWEAPYHPWFPVAAYALVTSRHMYEYGTTPEQLAWVAVSARRWAQRNPDAWSRDDLTIADVLAAPRVCDPIGTLDCCLVTDGGGALVVTSAERARTLRRKPVHVLGTGEAHSHRAISAMPSLTRTCAVESGARAFEEAGLRPEDVDSLQLYDAFTITPILFLEDLGFCAKGEGGAFVADGRIAPDGVLPVNTSGGGLSYAHPGMNGMQLLVEAVRQIRHHDRDVVLAHGNGGVLSTQCTVLLGSEAAAGQRPKAGRMRVARPAEPAARRRRGPVVRVRAR